MRTVQSGNPMKANVSWHALYEAALYETDREKVPERISQAELAILDRIRELFVTSGDHIEEQQFLDDALYALQALRSCAITEMKAA